MSPQGRTDCAGVGLVTWPSGSLSLLFCEMGTGMTISPEDRKKNLLLAARDQVPGSQTPRAIGYQRGTPPQPCPPRRPAGRLGEVRRAVIWALLSFAMVRRPWPGLGLKAGVPHILLQTWQWRGDQLHGPSPLRSFTWRDCPLGGPERKAGATDVALATLFVWVCS